MYYGWGKTGKQASRQASREEEPEFEHKIKKQCQFSDKEEKERKAKNVVILYDYAGKFNKFHI